MEEYLIEFIYQNWKVFQEINVSYLKNSQRNTRVRLMSLDLSMIVRPKSRTGSDNLTAEEVDEYHQIQGMKSCSRTIDSDFALLFLK